MGSLASGGTKRIVVSCAATKRTFSNRTFKVRAIDQEVFYMKIIEMPRKVEEYFKHGPRKIIKVIPNGDYSLTISFDNNETRVYHMAENLYGVFEILKDKEKFKEVFIDEYGNVAWDIDKTIDSNVHWNNRIDICKDAVYIESTPLSKA